MCFRCTRAESRTLFYYGILFFYLFFYRRLNFISPRRRPTCLYLKFDMLLLMNIHFSVLIYSVKLYRQNLT